LQKTVVGDRSVICQESIYTVNGLDNYFVDKAQLKATYAAPETYGRPKSNMEYSFRISDLFAKEVSVVGNDLIPANCPGLQIIGAQKVREQISEIMDTMGKASAIAQQLSTVITNAEKLRTSDQKVYFMVDFQANQVVGLLKVGLKKLFVYDQGGTQHEMNPLCILDFYVHESRQRQGCGKFLFDHMLRQDGVPVEHLAIDRPSDKLLFFLRKYYALSQMIPQVNNFAIFDGFFNQRADYAGKKARWGGLDQMPERQDKNQKNTVLEDSRLYNSQPSLHLRNGQQLPNYQPRRHDSTIGEVLQPTTNGNANGNHNFNQPRAHNLHAQNM
jgi:alpha-tubulin N-acetyltransferase 1